MCLVSPPFTDEKRRPAFWWTPYVDDPAREKHKTHKKKRSSYSPGKTDDFYILPRPVMTTDRDSFCHALTQMVLAGRGGPLHGIAPHTCSSHSVAIEWLFEWHCTSVGVTWSRPGYTDLLVNWLRSHAGTFNKLARSQRWHGGRAPSNPTLALFLLWGGAAPKSWRSRSQRVQAIKCKAEGKRGTGAECRWVKVAPGCEALVALLTHRRKKKKQHIKRSARGTEVQIYNLDKKLLEDGQQRGV